MTETIRYVGIEGADNEIKLVIDDEERFYEGNPLRHNYLISFKSIFSPGTAHDCFFIDGLDPVLEDLVNTCIRCKDWGYGPFCETHAKELA